jgi:MoaA/NifB/PqqE/SkfB family radical SAM enzyme
VKAKLQSRSPLEIRTNLAEVIPLPSPITMIVEVASVCNLRCTFCPTGDTEISRGTGKFRGLMDFALFEKIIADIARFDRPIKALHLHKDGEPLVHPQFPEMVKLAKSSPNILRVETTTNGILLAPDLNEKLAGSGIDRVKISVYGLSEQDFLKNSRVRVNFDRYIENIADLYRRRRNTEIYVKIMEEGLDNAKKQFFLDTFGDIADTVFFEHCVDTWPEFSLQGRSEVAVKTIGILGQPVRAYKKVCPQPFYNLTVCADGRMTACCADWEVKLEVGDARSESLFDVWNSPRYDDFRRMMLRGERATHPVCGRCGYPTMTCVDDIDDAAPKILENYNRKRP